MYHCSFLVFIKTIIRFIYFLPFADFYKHYKTGTTNALRKRLLP